MIEEALHAKLAADPKVAQAVAGRIYALRIPQNAPLPAIAYQRIGGEHAQSHDGISGLATARFQITCVGETYGAAKQLVEYVRLAIDGVGPTVWGTDTVHSVFLEDDADQAFEILPGSEAGLFAVRMDFTISYAEAQT